MITIQHSNGKTTLCHITDCEMSCFTALQIPDIDCLSLIGSEPTDKSRQIVLVKEIHKWIQSAA